jgi:hypothetical protein
MTKNSRSSSPGHDPIQPIMASPGNSGPAVSSPAPATGPEIIRPAHPLKVGRFRGFIRPQYRDALLLEALACPQRLLQSEGAEVLREGRNKVVVVKAAFSTGEKKEFVIKEFSSHGINKLKTLVEPSKAAKAWRGAMALVERMIETPAPVAFLERRKRGFVEECYFLAERTIGFDEIRGCFLNHRPGELEALLPALARHLAACHEAGILHRDLSDGNILLRKNTAGDYVFTLLDTNRIRVYKRLSTPRRVKNLIRLGIPRPQQRYFLEQYFGGFGLSPLSWLWYRLNKDVFGVYIGLKKILRLKKLARILRIQ